MGNSSIFRIVKNPDNPYVMVDKRFVNNPNLSWRAKGILLYLLSKPDDWKVIETDIIKHAKEGRDCVRTAVRELERHGYLIKEQQRNASGQITGVAYNVYELPYCDRKSEEIPTADWKADDGEADSGDTVTTNNDLELSNDHTNIVVEENSYPKDFETWWQIYPRKKEKKAAYKQYKATVKKSSHAELLKSATNYASECERENREEKFIKHAKTFLGTNDHWKEYLTDSAMSWSGPPEHLTGEAKAEFDRQAEVYRQQMGRLD